MADSENIEDPEAWIKKADAFFEQLSKSERVSKDEAEKLSRLGQDLKDAAKDSNQAKADSSKDSKTSKK